MEWVLVLVGYRSREGCCRGGGVGGGFGEVVGVLAMVGLWVGLVVCGGVLVAASRSTWS